MLNTELAYFQDAWGIHIPGLIDYLATDSASGRVLAMDAQPQPVTVSNAGIPAFLSNYIDPKIIKVLTTPNKAAQILSETKKGDWTSRTMMFPMTETTGETSAYGDWNNNGSVNANVQFPERQSFHYQTITQWGEKQLDEAGLAKIDWASTLNAASVSVLDKFQNLTYFFGVTGLRNYGLLNDPSLPASVTPGTKAAGGTTWTLGTPNEIYADVQKLFAQLVSQSGGLLDMDSRLVLGTTPTVATYLANKNIYGLSTKDMLKETFPNLRIETAVQYALTSGVNMAQLIAEEIDGQDTGYCAFTEKLRAHPIIQDLSSFKQKKSQGTWGAIILLPLAFASMTGV